MSFDIIGPPLEPASPHLNKPSRNAPIALFDATHGQANWAQTGFTSREMHTNFAGVVEVLCRLGCLCAPTGEQPLGKCLTRARLLVVPPPTGSYNAREQSWRPLPASLFTPGQISEILHFLRDGGRVFLSAYRFGDSFTSTNLGDLTSSLGCLLNDDVVIDLHHLRGTHPLQAHFDTPRSCLPLSWALHGVVTVRWGLMATFTVLPGASAWPLALSPGGSCLSFNRTHQQISFTCLPIAVAGVCGKGRFVLLGGPHIFETGTFGLLRTADNTKFLENVLVWLLNDGQITAAADPIPQPSADTPRDLRQVASQECNRSTVAYVERQLRSNGVLKALNQAKWMP